MLLAITTTHRPATDLGYLVHKNPARCQSFEMSFGKAYVFYPEATEEKCTVALLLDVDPIDMVRGKQGSRGGGMLDQYVNDRPYAASSFLSVAMGRAFSSAFQGKCNERPGLAEQALPFVARLAALPARGNARALHSLFEPLGYTVRTERHALDGHFPEWGESPYHTVELEKQTTLRDLLMHLYVLIPVLDNHKHYYIEEAEIDKLLQKGAGWLNSHPERAFITRRYLKFQPSLAREALARLMQDDAPVQESGVAAESDDAPAPEQEQSLNDARLGSVLAALRASGAQRVLDVGCGEGRLLTLLLKDGQFSEIVGMDVSVRALELAKQRLHLERFPERERARLTLLHGSLVYRDRRLEGYDAAAAVEVIEHLDAGRLDSFERVLFACAQPKTVVVTTPNREYNVRWENVGAEGLRHGDHRFEWTRAEFQAWAGGVAERHGYRVRFVGIGPEDSEVGAPTQMGVFTR